MIGPPKLALPSMIGLDLVDTFAALGGVLRVEPAARVVDPGVAVELVAAGLGDQVDHGAGESAVLGIGAETRDLHLLDPVHARQHPLRSELGIGDIHAVDVVGVLIGRRRAVGLVVLDTRGIVHHRRGITAQRLAFDEVLAEVEADVVVDRRDLDRIGDDDDLLADGDVTELEIDGHAPGPD